jgi:hypothetical protein
MCRSILFDERYQHKTAPTKPESYNGQAVSYIQYNSPVPYLYSWNFTIQRQLTGDTKVDVDYVGSKENNLPFNTDLNQIPERKQTVSAKSDSPRSAGSR